MSKETDEQRQLEKSFERRRYAFQKALPKSIKQISKGSGWKCSQGVLFREQNGWFVSASAVSWIAQAKTEVEFHAKPMQLDPLFWKIVRTETNVSLPLSFRYFGAWTCRTPPLFEDQFVDEESPNDLAYLVLQWADAKTRDFANLQWAAANFSRFIAEHPIQVERNGYVATLVTAKILIGERDVAQQICEKAIAHGDNGGFLIGGGERGTFPELATDWLAKEHQDAVSN
jgi:hypothetical protein